MKTKNERQNTFNNETDLLKLNLLGNSNEFLNKYNSPSKKVIYKSSVTSNYSNKNSNKIIANNFIDNSISPKYKSGNIFLSQNNNAIKLINFSSKNQEIRKNESINEGENAHSKLIKSYTKGADKIVKFQKNFLGNTNSRNFYDRKKTFQLVYKNSPKKKQKSPYKVFKTNLNDSLSDESNKKIFLYEDDETFTQNNNPLIIPDEDKIFDEINKLDYFVEKFKKRYKIKTSINNEEDKDIKTSKSVKIRKSKISTKNKEQEKFSKTFYDSNGNFLPSQLDKDIFDCLYKTNDGFQRQLNLLKKSKNKKRLKDYQTELLDFTKDIISVYGYDVLKKRLDEIQRYNKFKRKLNFKFIKKLENDEKVIIDDVNKANKKFVRKISQGSKRYKFKLPVLEFKSVIKKEDKDKKLKEFLKSRNVSQKVSRFSSSQSVQNNKILKKYDTNKIKYSLFKKYKLL